MTNVEIGEILRLANTNALNLAGALQAASGNAEIVLTDCTVMELLEILARNNIIIRAQYLGERE